ncbi:MAG: guanylate kinase [Dehalococcoidia bacterium]|nr:guanylate kinase [Dehalococcoidia bacterium]MDZ4246018.1 guanylate kinase [Dehalococcoidia bacterium]
MIISGPSGVGKDLIISHLKKRFPSVYYMVTLTTRSSRENEKDGVDYLFTSQKDFLDMIKNDELLEWSQVYGNYYGVPRNQVRQALANGQDIVLKIDVQGAKKIKEKVPGAILFFISPPSPEMQAARLNRRKTETAGDIETRLIVAREEMDYLPIFDYMAISHEGKVKQLLEQLEAVIIAEKCRVKKTPLYL